MKGYRTILRIIPGLVGAAWMNGSCSGAALAQGPSFFCAKARTGSIEEMICSDRTLSSLDRKLADVYMEASKATNTHRSTLQEEQRGWIKGRDECWTSNDKRRCVEEVYKLRIAELQALYRLVPGLAPVTFACDDDPPSEVIAMFFRTDPPTMVARRGDSMSLMYVQPSGSGARYQGPNESFWEHQGEALVTWGYGAPEMRCKKVP
jgi:uncharacterized protein